VTSVRDGRPNPMRQLVIVAFVVLALLSVPAFGQEQRGAEDRQSWLVGGGIGYRLGESATPRVSLERWFSRRFALGLGVEQAVLQLRPDVLEGQTFARGISVGLSARALVTAYEAPFRLAFVVIGITGVVAERSVSLGFVRFTQDTFLTGGRVQHRQERDEPLVRQASGRVRAGTRRTPRNQRLLPWDNRPTPIARRHQHGFVLPRPQRRARACEVGSRRSPYATPLSLSRALEAPAS